KAEPGLVEDARRQHRYNAACAAVLAGTGQSEDLAKLSADDKARLRTQGLAWLRADLDLYVKMLKGKMVDGDHPAGVILAAERLPHWQSDPDLAGVRGREALESLPSDEQTAWRSLWADVDALRQQARASYIETLHKGSLSPKEREQVHSIKMSTAKTYVIGMASTQFDTYLRLEDEQGKVLAENDDISKDDQ